MSWAMVVLARREMRAVDGRMLEEVTALLGGCWVFGEFERMLMLIRYYYNIRLQKSVCMFARLKE